MFTTQNFYNTIREGKINELSDILEKHPDWVNKKNEKGFPPLTLASYNSQLAVTNLLLVKGAQIDAQDIAGNTALMGVVFKGNLPIAQLLLEHGANPNIQNFQKATALIYAATFGQAEIAKLLIAKGANQNLLDEKGNTALKLAQTQGNQALMEILA